MPLNFPSTPSNGQIYTDGNNSWQYNSALGKWLQYENDPHILSPLPPSNDDGQLWYDTETGLLFVRYGGAWVEPAGYSRPIRVLTDDDIGSLVEAHDATIYTSADVGSTLARPSGYSSKREVAGYASIDWTGIPSWVTCIELFLCDTSTNGTQLVTCQIGDSGGIENTGYLGGAAGVYIASDAGINMTIGMQVRGQAAVDVHVGHIKWMLVDPATNTWVGAHLIHLSGAASLFGGVSKSLSGTLDRVRLTTASGADLFDAGFAVLRYS